MQDQVSNPERRRILLSVLNWFNLFDFARLSYFPRCSISQDFIFPFVVWRNRISVEIEYLAKPNILRNRMIRISPYKRGKIIYRNESSVEHHGVEFMIVAEVYNLSPNCSLSVCGEVLEI